MFNGRVGIIDGIPRLTSVVISLAINFIVRCPSVTKPTIIAAAPKRRRYCMSARVDASVRAQPVLYVNLQTMLLFNTIRQMIWCLTFLTSPTHQMAISGPTVFAVSLAPCEKERREAETICTALNTWDSTYFNCHTRISEYIISWKKVYYTNKYINGEMNLCSQRVFRNISPDILVPWAGRWFYFSRRQLFPLSIDDREGDINDIVRWASGWKWEIYYKKSYALGAFYYCQALRNPVKFHFTYAIQSRIHCSLLPLSLPSPSS